MTTDDPRTRDREVPAALNMDFSLTEEQQALVEALDTILADRTSVDRLKERDASEQWYDLDTWAAMARADLLGAAVPESAGGLGYGLLELALMADRVGVRVAPVPFVPGLVSYGLTLARHGTSEQRESLATFASGERLGTAALEEAGADPLAPTTRAERQGDGWRITGEKTLVPAANVADAILTPCAVGDGVAVLAVPVDAPGVTRERQHVMGLEPHFLVRYDGVAVGGGALVGGPEADPDVEPEAGRTILRDMYEATVAVLCAVAAGVAGEAVRITAAYATQREQFGRPIATFQALETRLADAYINAEAMHLTSLLAANRIAEGRDASLEVATAKYWAADGGHNVGHAALHCHGGVSIDLDYPIHRYFLWGKQIEFTLGGASAQLARLGRRLAAVDA